MSKNDKTRGTLEPISVEAKLTDSGVKASAKSRATTAFDRLLGNVADFGSAYLERHVRRVDIETTYREKLAKLRGDAALSGEEQRLLAKVITREHIADKNKRFIAEIALRDLSEQHESESHGDDRELSDDWLNFFGSYAEQASSERLQDLWGKILAGEIRRPGSFSLTTLRFVAELDQSVAAAFQEICVRKFQAVIPKEEEQDQDPDKLQKLLLLEEAGLISQAVGSLGGLRWTSPIPGEDGFCYFSAFEGPLKPGQHLLKVKTLEALSLSVIPLTRVGREIASLLPRESDVTILKMIAT